jgi:hypothetical protein
MITLHDVEINVELPDVSAVDYNLQELLLILEPSMI